MILQPSYIPWRGYFHQIQKADIFVFLDDVQFDRRGWRNRNRIKTAKGAQWLTVPVFSKNHQLEKTPITWGESLTVSGVFIALMLGLSCAWFATRDY